jgi:hypothetical protein
MEKKSRALRGLKRLKLGAGQNKNGMDCFGDFIVGFGFRMSFYKFKIGSGL